MGKVLIVDDEPSMRRILAANLRLDSHIVAEAAGALDATAILAREDFDVVLTDQKMPDGNGLDVLQAAKQGDPATSVIFLTAVGTLELAVESMKEGAFDFLTKPFVPDAVRAAVKRACEHSALLRENAVLRTAVLQMEGPDEIFGESEGIRAVRETIALVAPKDTTVLITGETGTGKELVARAVHRNSSRAQRAFIAINCASVSETLIESELFGYEAGAFTGATKSKPGKFEMCDKGTLLLDEIGEMSPPLQAKLLHVLQDGTFSRLGGRGEKRTNTRILAATNVDIQKALIEKTFREDLYYRLSTFVLHIPPLRERREEIPYVLTYLAKQLSVRHGLEPIAFSPEMIAACIAYHWPGNLREVGNFIKRYLVMRDESTAIAELEAKVPGYCVPAPASLNAGMANMSPDLKSMVRGLKNRAEMQAIRETLGETKWNRRIAATRLNISYKALLYKIRQYNLEAPARCA